jgi:flotillin
MFELLGLVIGGFIGLLLVGTVFVAQNFLWVCRPNEVLIISGRGQKLEDGTKVGYRVVFGGFSWQMPFLEKVDRMTLETMPIDVRVVNAYSKGGIPLEVSAIANVKVSSGKARIANAIERFLGQDPKEIRRVAKETLEGQIRGVVARMTPEEVNEDRLKFAREMMEEAGEEFEKLGLEVDTLKIQSVSDPIEYLDSIGRERLANVISEAENNLAKATAEWEARAKSAEERAEQQAVAARARAEQEYQELRTKLERLRLEAERVLPADAERKAAEMDARADAAHIAADGQAMAEVLRMMSDTWVKAGPDAKDIFLIQQLEQVLTTVVERVRGMQIGEVVLLDGGDGNALPHHVASLPATVGAVLREMAITTGIDVPSILSGTSNGRAMITEDPRLDEADPKLLTEETVPATEESR